MKLSSPSLAAATVVAVSCFAWTGGITCALVIYLELTNETGWLIAACLGLCSVAAVAFILFELKHAMVLPNDADTLAYLNFPDAPNWSPSTGSPPTGSSPVPSFQVRQ